MHFLRRFLAFIQKLCVISFHFPKINKGRRWHKSGGLENFSKINKRGGDDYSVFESTTEVNATNHVETTLEMMSTIP